jgi:glycosyltransferase involved in cell wall biosynthesis
MVHSRPLRVLSVLGQRPAMTGSGVAVTALFKAGMLYGDRHYLVCAGYTGDDWSAEFGDGYEIVLCTDNARGEIPFPVPGMSDVMPYRSCRYRDLPQEHVDDFLTVFRRSVDRAIRELNPDLLHLHHLWVLTALASHVPLPCVVTVHGTDLQQAKLAPQHRYRVVSNLPRIAHLFCVSQDIAADTRREYSIPENRTSVIGNGFDGRVFSPNGHTHPKRRKLVLCVGKFVPWKGFSYAIKASARVGTPHDLVILGDGPRVERQRLEREASRLGVDLHLPGHVEHDQVATWMRTADAFLLTSVHEPFGLALLEAMACGCRVVASASGGPRDLVEPDNARRGLATLVRPLDSSDATDEERYVNDLGMAIRFQLGQETTPLTRAAIAATVAARSWGEAYARIRQVYLSLQLPVDD